MLKFIFGLAATGKTSKVLELIKNDVENGKKAVLIIPEQFSFESEKAVLRLLGDSQACLVEVLSFSRICDAVERITGGICARTLLDSDKLILMKRAIKQAADELKIFSKYKNSLGFAKAMLDTIDEFKTNAVTADMLKQTAQSEISGALSAKLNDIASIFESFDMLLGQEFIDPTDRLTRLYERLSDTKYFENKSVYIDSFKGFTGQQFKIIDRIISQAGSVCVSLSCDTIDGSDFNVFSNIRKTVNRIKSRAEAYSVAVDNETVLKKSFYKSKGLVNVEKLLSGNNVEQAVCGDGVTVCAANTVYDEAEFVARTIRRLVRENENLRYKDFVIIARDTVAYEEAVLSACKKNGVSCFLDKRYQLSAFPPALAALAAMEAVASFSTSVILRFYKTGISTIDNGLISKIENYTYIWNVDGALWTKEWKMNPKGFVSGEADQSTLDELQLLNEARKQIIAPFLEFKQSYKGSAKARITAILKLFERCDAQSALKNMCDTYKQNDNEAYKQALMQSWDMLMSCFDSMAECIGEEEISSREFADFLKAAVCGTQIGVIPQMLDEVSFGAADRIRPSRPKIAFILGANQNVFPRGLSAGGLLANSERQALIAAGIEISDHALDEAIDEEFLVYTNVCCPTERLYICYHTLDREEKAAEPSAFVVNILDSINCTVLSEPSALSFENAPETTEAAFGDLCRALGNNSKVDAASISAALEADSGAKRRMALVKNGYSNRDMSLSADTAKSLFGNKLKISPSKLDTFMRCSFSYFCKYGLRIKKLQPAEFDVMQRGTIVHYVLERIISEYKEEVSTFDESKISQLVELYINEYLDSIKGYREVETPKMRYLVFTIARSLKEVVAQLSKEFAQSGFKPCRCELLIGSDEVPSPEIEFSSDRKISVEGIVDRMDIWNGYVRVVDYKTGSRKFRLPDILVGQNMQMLIYLYAIVKTGAFEGYKPAGIFYMPSRRDLRNEGMRMDGLAVENLEVVSAMEAENKGEFVPPLKYNKSGEIYSSYKNSFISETDFDEVFRHIESTLYKMGDKIYNGKFSVNPVDGLDSKACKYCDFASVCGIEDTPCEAVNAINNSEVIEFLREGVNDDV